AVEGMLAEDAEIHSDGGGRVSAALVVIRGRHRVARFLTGVFGKKRRDCEMLPTPVNGAPGVVLLSDGAVYLVMALSIEADVQAIYITVNPDKLARWSAAQVQ
ncbi:hypothetical protein ACYOEI_41940, partial [Singulisphaera rosea]